MTATARVPRSGHGTAICMARDKGATGEGRYPSQTLAKGWVATGKGEKGQLAQWEMKLEKLGRDFGWEKKG